LPRPCFPWRSRWRGRNPYLIAAGVLGPVQRHVGSREQLEQVVAVLAEHRDPIETVTLMRASAAEILRLAVLVRSRSAIPYAPAPSVRGSSTVNSSPPNRPTTSDSRTCRLSSVASARSTASASRCQAVAFSSPGRGAARTVTL
jgi:hypothetical protein